MILSPSSLPDPIVAAPPAASSLAMASTVPTSTSSHSTTSSAPQAASTSTSTADSSSTPDELLEETNSVEDEDDSRENSNKVDTPCLDKGRVTRKFIADLVVFYKRQKRLPTATANKILQDAKILFMQQPSLVDVELGKNDVLNICGDIHGQFFDLARIFELFGQPSERNQYLFNGDFVDRGPWSVEVMFLLLSYKLLWPGHFFLARGNHETEEVNRLYGFQNEVKDKYDSRMFDAFQEVFNWLPLAHCVNESVLAMHGGLAGDDDVTLDDIRRIKRGRPVERHGLMCDLLWADPQDDDGRFPNGRGFSYLFGPDVTESFLRQNNLLYIVRSHECVQYGYDLCHDDKVVTVFSAPNYCDRGGNKGAICILHGDDVSMPEFRKFDAAPHPKVNAMAYASLFMRMGLI